MRVMVTNDDGVEAPGVFALAQSIAEAGHEVVVVAPAGERSGSSAAIGRLHRAGPMVVTDVEWPALPGVAVHSIDASPAAAVYATVHEAFGPRPDVVASGVNPGLNCGHLVLHSGTVGAGLTAAALGVPAVAVSVAWAEHPEWATATALVPGALDWLATARAPCVLNLNVPGVAASELRGVRATVPAPYLEQWTVTTSPAELHLEYTGRFADPPPGTDLAAVLAGYASVTVLTGVGVAGLDRAEAAVTAITSAVP